jgi:hypothetical protein
VAEDVFLNERFGDITEFGDGGRGASGNFGKWGYLGLQFRIGFADGFDEAK